MKFGVELSISLSMDLNRLRQVRFSGRHHLPAYHTERSVSTDEGFRTIFSPVGFHDQLVFFTERIQERFGLMQFETVTQCIFNQCVVKIQPMHNPKEIWLVEAISFISEFKVYV